MESIQPRPCFDQEIQQQEAGSVPAFLRSRELAAHLLFGLYFRIGNFAVPSLLLNKEELSLHRASSTFGNQILKEQGIIIFRNSWGDVPGINGYQAMTFDFFFAHMIMSIPQQNSLMIMGDLPQVNLSAITINGIKKKVLQAYCPKN